MHYESGNYLSSQLALKNTVQKGSKYWISIICCQNLNNTINMKNLKMNTQYK